MVHRLLRFLKRIYHQKIHRRKPGVLGAGSVERFAGHYDEWREKRVAWMLKKIAKEVAGITVLEVGCGYGQIDYEFMRLGAKVTFSDARREHLDVVNNRYSSECKTVLCDLDTDFPDGRYDLVLHLGVLYHLRNPEEAIRRACASTDHMFLETEVVDSDDPYGKYELFEIGYDQAYGEVGTRPSTAYVERVLKDCGFIFDRLSGPDCNAPPHFYDWRAQNDGRYEIGLRRIWYCRRS